MSRGWTYAVFPASSPLNKKNPFFHFCSQEKGITVEKEKNGAKGIATIVGGKRWLNRKDSTKQIRMDFLERIILSPF